MSDSEAVRFALMENLQREDLNPVEETEGILELLAITLDSSTAEVPLLLQRLHKDIKRKKLSHNVMGQPEVESAPAELAIIQSAFESLGRMSWESFTSNRLPLLNLPADILEALRAGRIEYTKAKEIAKLESESERQELLEEASASSLSLSQIRERVRASQPPPEQGEFAARIDATTKQVKKLKVWENPSKRSRLELLLKQLEELISEEGVDEAQPIEEALAHQDEPQFTAKSEQDSSLPIESGLDSLESQKDITKEFESESSPPREETAEVPEHRETPASSSDEQPQPDTKEEPTQLDSQFTDELPAQPLTHTEMVKRLGVGASTLSDAKKKPNFAEWSRSKDPDAIAWQWVAQSKQFVPLKN
jgi:ParB-like chromosome segregation protein Spo0J